MQTFCSGGQGADGKGSEKFNFSIYIHFPFRAPSWAIRRDRGKGSENKTRPQSSWIFREGIAKLLEAEQPRASLCPDAGLELRWNCRLCCRWSLGFHCTPSPSKENSRLSPEPSSPRSRDGPDPRVLPLFPL